MSDDKREAARSAVKAAVKRAPITVLAGGGFDLRLKKALKLNYHQSILSKVMKELVASGEVELKKVRKVIASEGATSDRRSYIEHTYTFIE